jgi:acetyl-CoA acetyltransferase
MTERTFVVGVGMTKFEKPGSKEWDYPDMAREAGGNALADAGITYDQVEQAFVGYCYGDSTSGQRALYELGLSGIPAVNVNNNCSTGSSALYLARTMVKAGVSDCVLALGFEKMQRGSLGTNFEDRTNPMDKHIMDMIGRRGFAPSPPAAQVFGNAGKEYMERYPTVTNETFARIGEKNHRHSVNNPYSQFQDEYSLEDIMNAPMVYDPLTKLQCCPTSDGSGAAIIASERFVREHGLEGKAVEIVGQAMTTDFENTFDGSDMSIAGFHMTKAAAQKVYEESGLGPEDVQVIELHDCFSANELITYEGLGLCEPGKAGELIHDGAVTYGGKWVVNPSGGLISKGHPLGATGLAQCAELSWQIRGEADKRQNGQVTAALQHNLGLGGAAVVTMYRKAEL